MAFDFVQLDTGSTLRVTCKDSDTEAVIDLTGATLTLRYKIGSAAKVEKTMTLEVPNTAGIATYKFLAAELSNGDLVGEVTINDSGGKEITSIENMVLPIKQRIV